MLVNLTPHAINFVLADGFELTLESEGIARAKTETKVIGSICSDEIPLVKVVYGEPEGLPDPVDGTYYIVSAITAAAAKAAGGRTDDLLTTADLVRDEAGRVIGCRALAVV